LIYFSSFCFYFIECALGAIDETNIYFI